MHLEQIGFTDDFTFMDSSPPRPLYYTPSSHPPAKPGLLDRSADDRRDGINPPVFFPQALSHPPNPAAAETAALPGLFKTIRDASACQIIRRKLHGYLIAGKDANEIHPHLA